MKSIAFLCKIVFVFGVSLSFYAQIPVDKKKISLDDIMNFGKNKVDISKIPDQYLFSWKYTMQISTEKGKSFETDYFLEPDAQYYGSSVKDKKQSQMFMVMDAKRKIMISTFGEEGKKMAMANNLPDYSKIASESDAKFNYKSVAGKEILGYSCKGMEASNDRMTITFYYTNDAKISFLGMFQITKNNMPDALKGYFKPNEKPLSLEVIYFDKEKNKTTVMKCIALEKQSMTFNKSDYKFM